MRKNKKLEEKGSEMITEKTMNDEENSDLWFDGLIHEHGKVKIENKKENGVNTCPSCKNSIIKLERNFYDISRAFVCCFFITCFVGFFIVMFLLSHEIICLYLAFIIGIGLFLLVKKDIFAGHCPFCKQILSKTRDGHYVAITYESTIFSQGG